MTLNQAVGVFGILLLAPPFASGTLQPFDPPSAAINIYENIKSRPLTWGSSPAHERNFYIVGTTDPAAALRALLRNSELCPLLYSETDQLGFVWMFIRENVTVDPTMRLDETGGTPKWHATCKYALIQQSAQPRNDGESVTTFAIGEEQVNVKQAISEIAGYAAAGADAVSRGGKIGLTADGAVQGVDITVPTFKFTRIVYMANSQVTEDYINAVWSVAMAPVNNAPFLGFDAGEVKFVGLSGTRRNKNAGWELNFEFAVSVNSTNAAPASPITGIAKKGWEYLWFEYEMQTATVGENLYPDPNIIRAYVDQVYNSSDFSVLGVPPQ